jgi:hypothetical protein
MKKKEVKPKKKKAVKQGKAEVKKMVNKSESIV